MGDINSTNKKYEEAAQHYDEALGIYAGDAGAKKMLNAANENAMKQAGLQSQYAGDIAGQKAMQAARTSGLNKAQSAMLGGKAAYEATRDTYGNIYNTAGQQGLDAYKTGYTNALTGKQNLMTTEQQEGKNKFDRAWGNVSGFAQLGKGLTGMAGDIGGLIKEFS